MSNDEIIEQITILLSKKESERDSKRQKCTDIFENIQKLKIQMSTITEDLHCLDDAINLLEKRRDRLVISNGYDIVGNGGNAVTMIIIVIGLCRRGLLSMHLI